MLNIVLQVKFLFEELVKRDFKKKYKGTFLGIGWSVLAPLINLLVMRVVFSHFFAGGIEHYTTYLFCGNLVFSYFNESSSQGMLALRDNAHIFSKINVPKYLFLFSKNVQTFINFAITLVVFFLFCIIDHIVFSWHFFLLVFPITMLLLFNLGLGLVLSALYVFFRDMRYLWNVFLQLLMYASAIFYSVDVLPDRLQKFFLINPVYDYIKYFRIIVLENDVPPLWLHGIIVFYTVVIFGIGCFIYKKYNHEFLYYV